MRKIYPGTVIPADAELGDFVVIGQPVASQPELPPSVFGARAVIRSHTVVYAGNRVGDNFLTGHGVLLRESNEVGDDVSIGSHSVVEHHTKIGDRVRIHSNAFIPEYTVLEDDVWIGPCAVLTNAKYPQSPEVKQKLKGAHIRRGAMVGAGVVLLPGVVIGERALIGAGAVVCKDVADGEVIVGNPGKALKQIGEIDDYSM